MTRVDPRPDAVAVPPARDVALMVVALSAVSTSGPLIAACAAPALAIAFWRNALATVALAPAALLRRRGELRRLTGREWRLMLLAGALLAGHFATWIPAVTLTTVASATALVATQPVWAALLARAQGHLVRPAVWAGIGLAVGGAVLLTGADLAVSGDALLGDVLATVGGAFAAAYATTGSAVRRSVSTTTYTFVCYGSCALLLLGLCLVGQVDLGGYEAVTWVQLVALTAGAQLLGHSLFNVVLRTTSPTVVSLSILFEIPGAALLAAVWLDQVPPVTAVPGLLLLVAGVAVTVRARSRGTPASVPVE